MLNKLTDLYVDGVHLKKKDFKGRVEEIIQAILRSDIEEEEKPGVLEITRYDGIILKKPLFDMVSEQDAWKELRGPIQTAPPDMRGTLQVMIPERFYSLDYLIALQERLSGKDSSLPEPLSRYKI